MVAAGPLTTRLRRVHSVANVLVRQSKEAALNAVQSYNNPLTVFKSESFIVLMIIAWTRVLHAYYHRKRVEYRNYKSVGRRREFERIHGRKGAFKYWGLERCLNDAACPIDSATSQNLRFLIHFRNEIEHHMSPDFESYMLTRYQACCLNYEFWLTALFGIQESLSDRLLLALQFADVSYDAASGSIAQALPTGLSNFILDFESTMADEDLKSTRYNYRLYFLKTNVNRPGQADSTIQFIDPSSPVAEEIAKDQWVIKEVEKPKYRPKEVVQKMQAEGFPRFNMAHHTQLWKMKDGRSSAHGYGVNVAGTWYWYDRWLGVVRGHCRDNAARYG